MPSRSWQFRIDDILEAINKIERFTYIFNKRINAVHALHQRPLRCPLRCDKANCEP